MTKSTQQHRKLTRNWFEKLLSEEKNNHFEIFRHLNSGFSFSLLRNEYDQILDYAKSVNASPKFMHYYFGLTDEGKLRILITDNVSDKSSDAGLVFEKELEGGLFDTFMSNVDPISEKWDFIMKEYHNSQKEGFENKTQIAALSTLSRYLRWNVFGEEWLKAKLSDMKKGHRYRELTEAPYDKRHSYPLITLPFESIKNHFDPTETKKVTKTVTEVVTDTKSGKISEKVTESVTVTGTEAEKAYHFFGLKLKDGIENATSIKDYTFEIVVTSITREDIIEFLNLSCLCEAGYGDNIDNFSLLPDFS